MVQQSINKTDGKYFFLEKKDLLNRKQKVNLHDFKKEEIKIFVKMASKIPFIKAVALTGSAAVGNAAKEDDLDFMVICQRNTLWLTRFLLILLIKFHKKRPKPDRPGGWCVNLLLDESDLTLDEKRRSLYEAYEILQMQFILDLDEYEKYFLNANDWLKKYLFYYHKYPFAKYKAKLVYSVFNQFFFYLQKSYRQIIFGQENFSVSLTQAFFNNIDFKYQLLKTLERKLGPEKQ
jgi:predicted nucleotidyltransferase